MHAILVFNFSGWLPILISNGTFHGKTVEGNTYGHLVFHFAVNQASIAGNTPFFVKLNSVAGHFTPRKTSVGRAVPLITYALEKKALTVNATPACDIFLNQGTL